MFEKLILKVAKFIYRNISKFGLDYEDNDVKELGELIRTIENVKERRRR